MSTGTTSSDYTRGIEKCVLAAFQALPQPLGPCPSPLVPYPTTPGEKAYLLTKVTACPLFFAPENTAGTCSSGRGTLLLQQKLYQRVKGIEDIAVPVQTNPSSLYTSRIDTSIIESTQQPNTIPPILLGAERTYVVQGRFAEFFPPNIPHPCRKRI
jgi:hypothetical protein